MSNKNRNKAPEQEQKKDQPEQAAPEGQTNTEQPNEAPVPAEGLKEEAPADPSQNVELPVNSDAPAAPVDAPVLEKGELIGQTTTTITDGEKTVQHEVHRFHTDSNRSDDEFKAIHNPTKEPVELEKVEEAPKRERGQSRYVTILDESPFAPSDVSPEAMAQQQAESAAAIYLDRIKKDGTAGEKMVVETMEAYLAVMGTGKPLNMDAIVREQTRLYSLIKNIGRRNDDFRKSVVVLRFFFRSNSEGAFHDYRLYRGHEALQMSADDRKAFHNYLQFFKIIASVNDLKDVKKSVDVSRSLNNPVIPAEVKERYVSLVN